MNPGITSTCLVVLALIVSPWSSVAQLVPDTTLGSQASSVSTSGSRDTVTGGVQTGGNLFHSFLRFNVQEGRSLYFTDPGVSNIFTRITGTELSFINGQLGVNGPANLFLINPNGIVVGSRSSLDIRGSFVATTVPVIRFSDGSEFSATNAEVPTLLTVSVPLGLQWGLAPPGSTITNRGTLTVGQDLTLVADRLDLQGQLQAGRDLTLVATRWDQMGQAPILSADRDVKLDLSYRGPSLLVQAGGGIQVQGTMDITGANGTALFTGTDRILTTQAGLILRSGQAALSDTGTPNSIPEPNPGANAGILLQGPVTVASGGMVQLIAAGTGDINTQALTVPKGTIGMTGSSITTNGQTLDVSTVQGDAGTITLTAVNGPVSTGNLSAFSYGSTGSAIGHGGRITVSSPGDLRTGSISTYSLNTDPNTTMTGHGGDIRLSSTNGTLGTEALFSFSTTLIDPQLTVLTPQDLARFTELRRSSNPGRGGNIQLEAGQTITLGGPVSTSGSGGSGNIGLTAGRAIEIQNQVLASDTFGEGTAGAVQMTAPLIRLTDGAQISTGSHGTGKGGDITLTARSQLEITGATSRPPTLPLNIQTPLGVKNFPNTYLGGYVPSGDLNTIASSPSFPSGVFSQSTRNSTGNAGNIRVQTGELRVSQQGTISTNTFGSGNAGNITLQSSGPIALNGGSITNGVSAGAAGNSGAIAMAAPSITLFNRGRIQAITTGTGRAGDIEIQARTLTITGEPSAIVSGSGTPNERGGAIGDGGNVRMTVDILQIQDAGIVSTSTFTDGQGGNIFVTAQEVDLLTQGRLSATTQGRGNAGSITVQAGDRVNITGDRTGLFAVTAPQSSGDGGSIFVTTGRVQIREQGSITAGSQGQGKGGDIQLIADQMSLDGRSVILADTVSNQGGNIQIQARDLLGLRRNSLISTNAGTAEAGGNGGNIGIKAGFVVGVLAENSDITANAFTGSGGRVDITANGVFGLQFQPQLTALSDITASSKFGISGTVTITTLNIDPNRGLVELPTTLTDTSNQIAQTCSPRQQRNRFVVTGRGGLSPDPDEALNQTLVWTEEPQQGNQGILKPIATSPVEAIGWRREADGGVVLVAKTGTVAPLIENNLCRRSGGQ